MLRCDEFSKEEQKYQKNKKVDNLNEWVTESKKEENNRIERMTDLRIEEITGNLSTNKKKEEEELLGPLFFMN